MKLARLNYTSPNLFLVFLFWRVDTRAILAGRRGQREQLQFYSAPVCVLTFMHTDVAYLLTHFVYELDLQQWTQNCSVLPRSSFSFFNYWARSVSFEVKDPGEGWVRTTLSLRSRAMIMDTDFSPSLFSSSSHLQVPAWLGIFLFPYRLSCVCQVSASDAKPTALQRLLNSHNLVNQFSKTSLYHIFY